MARHALQRPHLVMQTGVTECFQLHISFEFDLAKFSITHRVLVHYEILAFVCLNSGI